MILKFVVNILSVIEDIKKNLRNWIVDQECHEYEYTQYNDICTYCFVN